MAAIALGVGAVITLGDQGKTSFFLLPLLNRWLSVFLPWKTDGKRLVFCDFKLLNTLQL